LQEAVDYFNLSLTKKRLEIYPNAFFIYENAQTMTDFFK